MKDTYWIARWKASGNSYKETRATGPRLYPSLKMAKARVGKANADKYFDFIEVTLERIEPEVDRES